MKRLFKFHKENEDFRTLLCKVYDLVFVPPGFGFEVYKKEIAPGFEKLVKQTPGIKTFQEYLQYTYLGRRVTRKTVKEPLFPHKT